jgi:hypothetical protein
VSLGSSLVNLGIQCAHDQHCHPVCDSSMLPALSPSLQCVWRISQVLVVTGEVAAYLRAGVRWKDESTTHCSSLFWHLVQGAGKRSRESHRSFYNQYSMLNIMQVGVPRREFTLTCLHCVQVLTERWPALPNILDAIAKLALKADCPGDDLCRTQVLFTVSEPIISFSRALPVHRLVDLSAKRFRPKSTYGGTQSIFSQAYRQTSIFLMLIVTRP